MLRLLDLANRPDFVIGPMRVSPVRRLLEGPGASATVEPIVMKVLLVLLDARGKVVTREALFESAWGGVFVGDDSLNRAIAQVRKAAAEVAPGTFQMETIPRTGYRLIGEGLNAGDVRGDSIAADFRTRISRRFMIGSAAAASLASAASLSWWWIQSREDRHFDQLIERAEAAIRTEDAGPSFLKPLEEAVAFVQAAPGPGGYWHSSTSSRHNWRSRRRPRAWPFERRRRRGVRSRSTVRNQMPSWQCSSSRDRRSTGSHANRRFAALSRSTRPESGRWPSW